MLLLGISKFNFVLLIKKMHKGQNLLNDINLKIKLARKKQTKLEN